MKSILPNFRGKHHIKAFVLAAIIFVVADYFLLLPYNVMAPETWLMAAAFLAGFGLFDVVFGATAKNVHFDGEVVIDNIKEVAKKKLSVPGVCFMAAIALVAVMFLLQFLSSPMFNARRYANIAGNRIEQRNFIEDTPVSESIDNIALMDTGTAQIIGSRALGSLSELVSQFEIDPQYTQINLGGVPMKVTPLNYADFFKYLANKEEGIPGYIKVDPVKNTSEYVQVDQPIVYSQSSYFGKYLMRHLRFEYRTAIFGDIYFEIGEDGKPYYIAPVLTNRILLFGGRDVKGVVTCNASTGETQYYDVADVPSWVDIVYDGSMLTEQYDWYGMYSGGYMNSLFTNKDCKKVTDNYGFKMFDDDVWVFTGVTSVVSDESNIGFVLMNSRTGEIRYYAIPGAEEYSVMRSAEGEVQHLGYSASFPSVINIDGQPTYIMVLKDKGSLVKQYALIHVERYNIVATGETQEETIAKYRAKLMENGFEVNGATEEDKPEADAKTIRVDQIQYLVQDGNSYAYIISGTDIYRMPVSQDETIILVEAGDRIKISAYQEESGIYAIISFEN